jgi:hypothetical protein
MFMTYSQLIFAAGTILLSIPAHATALFSFPSGGTDAGSGYGNVRTFSSGTVTVTVTAWGLTGNWNTTFQNGFLGQYATYGLGDCDHQETAGCDSPNHQVDNAVAYDFVLFQFSAPVMPASVTIQPYGSWDRDVSYYTGNVAAGLNLTGVSFAGLNALGFTNFHNDDSSVSSSSRIVTLMSGPANSLLFGARVNGDSSPDYFKIQALTVTAAPEPGPLAFTGAALIAIAAISQRVTRRK